MIGKRPVYEVSITTTRARTKQLSKVKKGNIIKKQKSSYDTKKKVIRYTTSQHSQRVTGE